MGEVIIITSGKGGVGKTTLTANIGCSLALNGKRTLLVDGDIGLRNLDVILGLENNIVYDIIDLIEGSCNLKQALVRDKRFSDKLFLLPASQMRDKSEISFKQLSDLMGKLREQFDYILIDCPAGIGYGFRNASHAADSAIIVVNPESTSVRDAERVVGILSRLDIINPYLVINKLRPKMVEQGDMISPQEIIERLGLELLGIILDDEGIIRGNNSGTPIVITKSAVAKEINNITKRLLGEAVPMMQINSKKSIIKLLRNALHI